MNKIRRTGYYPVTEIGHEGDEWNEGAFFNCEGITGVTIPVSVTEIREGAFAGWGNNFDNPSQKIIVEGYADQDEADDAWGADWRNNRNLDIIVYDS